MLYCQKYYGFNDLKCRSIKKHYFIVKIILNKDLYLNIYERCIAKLVYTLINSEII